MTRDEEITTLARRMTDAWRNSFGISGATICATIAIELAEATREAAGNVCEETRILINPGNDLSRGFSLGISYAADNVRAMPLPIADGGGGQDTECATGETTR